MIKQRFFWRDFTKGYLSYLKKYSRKNRYASIQNNKRASVYRNAGGLTGNFWMSDDFNETPDCFKEYM